MSKAINQLIQQVFYTKISADKIEQDLDSFEEQLKAKIEDSGFNLAYLIGSNDILVIFMNCFVILEEIKVYSNSVIRLFGRIANSGHQFDLDEDRAEALRVRLEESESKIKSSINGDDILKLKWQLKHASNEDIAMLVTNTESELKRDIINFYRRTEVCLKDLQDSIIAVQEFVIKSRWVN